MSTLQTTGFVVIVSGLSGSGKSTALKSLEDNGYLAIDNLPILLLPKFLSIRKESNGFIRVAVGIDAREKDLQEHYEEVFAEVKSMGYELSVIFLEADHKTLVKRFSETRRPHHLALDGDILKGISLEQKYLEPIHHIANHIINTTGITAQKLREKVIQLYSANHTKRQMSVEVLSFGFKNGLPPEADLMVDVRFLPNPFYIDELRNLDGRDQPVKDYVMSNEETIKFLEKFSCLVEYLLPLYQKEGKSYLTIAVGCTGGQHRSVAVAEALWENVKKIGPGSVNLRHRDIS